MQAFDVRVAGSSANLGPGFDCLAIALSSWLKVVVTPNETGAIRATNASDLLGGANLVVEAMVTAASRLGVVLPGCDIEITSEIPVARGLGSSGAAIIGGILAAAKLADVELSDDDAIDIGGEMEGHADNVAASLLGGVTAAMRGSNGYVARRLATTSTWQAVIFVPDNPAFTAQARSILPPTIPLADASFNVGRAAMLSLAFREQQPALLREAMQDRLHQPYRSAIFPHLDPTIAAALEAGADGACLSGAGPSVLALAQPDVADDVAQAMEAAGLAQRVSGSTTVLTVPERGSWVE
jgi:homoserine kinase